jgi:hypothetical protein
MAGLPPQQTVAIKGINSNDVLWRVREAVICKTSPGLGIYHFPDKDPSCAGQYLLYANYPSGEQCVLALDTLRLFFHQHMPDCGLSLNRKIDLLNRKTPYFSVWVGSVPPSSSKADVAAYFGQFGKLHPCVPVASAGESAVFVNYLDFEGTSAVMAAHERRELRLENSVMCANPARNTTFVNLLIKRLRDERKFSFTVDEAIKVATSMSKEEWPPKDSDVSKLCCAVPKRFLVDPVLKQFLLIDPQARLAPKRPSPIYTSEHDAELAGEDHFDLLQTLFLELWCKAKGRSWEDSWGGIASSSVVELREELCREEERKMLAPLRDWDLPMLCTALTARSLKEQLEQYANTSSPQEDVLTDASKLRVLVDDKIVTLEDLEEKYAACFLANTRAPQAVQTIRFVRNILFHLGGRVCVNGLSKKAFDVLFGVTKGAFETLAQVLCDSHPETTARFYERCRELLQSAQGAEGFPSGDATSSLDSSSDSSTSSLYSSSHSSQTTSDDEAESVVHEVAVSATAHHGLANWSKDEVLSFFEHCKFPTAGIQAGEVDGGALLKLYRAYTDATNAHTAKDAEELFTTPAPEGLGLKKLMFRGRFKSEMAKLGVQERDAPA